MAKEKEKWKEPVIVLMEVVVSVCWQATEEKLSFYKIFGTTFLLQQRCIANFRENKVFIYFVFIDLKIYQAKNENGLKKSIKTLQNKSFED